MTDQERFDRLEISVARLAALSGDSTSSDGGRRLTETLLATQAKIELTQATIDLVSEKILIQSQEQSAMLQRQAEQYQRFDILIAEIRGIVRRLGKDVS